MNETGTGIEFRVRYGETDQMGVVYHAEYFVWFDMGRTELIRSLGVPYVDIERAGVALAVAEASVRYHAPARYDDLIHVETRVARVASRVIDFDYVVTRADTGTRLASARTTMVAMDRAGRATTIPAELRARLASHAQTR